MHDIINPSSPDEGNRPTRPADLASVSLRELLDAWHAHLTPLVNASHGIGDPQPHGRLRGDALDMLAVGQALADRLMASRWSTVVDALAYGAAVDQVATAMGLEPDEVAAGLRSWATGQLHLNRDTGGRLGLDPARHDQVLALLDEAGR